MPGLSHRGLPVPWVLRWSEEIVSEPYKMTPTGIAYPAELPADRYQGALMLREHDKPGAGEPQWTQMHSHRQFRCMSELLCQVCGRKIDGKATWLIPATMAKVEIRGNRARSSTPPTCDDCIPVAQELCPHLNARGSLILDVRGYRLWGIFGDFHYDGTARKRLGEVQFGDDRIKYLLAKQLIVEIYDFRRRRPV